MKTPDNTHRTSITGRTGSGKTQFGVWYLGEQIKGPWSEMPVTMIDTKRDALIAQLPATEISISKKPPTDPGLYVVRPAPDRDDRAVEEYLDNLWLQENHGLYIDEGYMLGTRNSAFRRLLTQGRSKHIPMIYLSQRPVYMDRFAFSEADFFAMFHLAHADDVLIARKMVPNYDRDKLERYQAFWYDVGNDEGVILNPVPDAETIVSSIDATLTVNETGDTFVQSDDVEDQRHNMRLRFL